jgi:hypothetical protein
MSQVNLRRARFTGVSALVVPVALTVALLAAPASSVGATPRCSTSNLYLSFVRSQGATGHRFWDLGLRNVGPTTCHLRGFPGVAMLNSGAGLINIPVKRATGHPVRTVVLSPFRRAFFTFSFVSSGPCIPNFFSGFGLQVFPPNNTHRLRLFTGRFDVCNPSIGGNPQVLPVRRTLNGT